MTDIKPEEISAILRQQLSSFNTSAQLEEVGTVLHKSFASAIQT